MKINVLKENLAKTIQLAVKFSSTKANMPVLGFVSIEATGKGIFVTATNLDVGVRIQMAGKIIEEGVAVIPARIVGELVQSLPLGGIELTIAENGELNISGQRMKAKLQTMKAEDFPPFPLPTTALYELSVNQFVKAFDKVGFSISGDETRPILTGFLWQADQGLVVATDGYRLSMDTNKQVWGIDRGQLPRLIVPGKAATQLLQVFEDLKLAKVRVGFLKQSQQLVFVGNDVVGVVRVLMGEFPKYEGILPQQLEVRLTLNREQLLSAVRAAAIFARDSANIVKLQFNNSVIEVSANAAQVGENIVEVEVEVEEGVEGTIAFNSKYLIDLLTHMTTDRITFGMNDSLKPGMFMEVGNDHYKHVIMPVRVRE
jgi:DNA polymerase-3 subunit beta